MKTHCTRTLLVAGLAAFTGCDGAGTKAEAAPRSTTQTPASAAAHTPGAATVSPEEARRLLTEGNARFVSGGTLHPRQGAGRRAELATTQHPFAVVLGCADSRTGPEIVFDQGLGDLFVVREAGNVVDAHTLGSIEYAIEHLHSPLIVVLGHERCGAIAAARDTVAANGHAEGHIDSLVAAIRPAVESTAGQDAEATCKANIRNVVKAVASSEPILRHLAAGGKIVVLGAYYDLDTGMVTFL